RTGCWRLLRSVENELKERYPVFPLPLERTAYCSWKLSKASLHLLPRRVLSQTFLSSVDRYYAA
ncbi:uncharacterized protein BT62DRAFT_1080428, partial [Guyanagaster necrorhizus]